MLAVRVRVPSFPKMPQLIAGTAIERLFSESAVFSDVETAFCRRYFSGLSIPHLGP